MNNEKFEQPGSEQPGSKKQPEDLVSKIKVKKNVASWETIDGLQQIFSKDYGYLSSSIAFYLPVCIAVKYSTIVTIDFNLVLPSSPTI